MRYFLAAYAARGDWSGDVARLVRHIDRTENGAAERPSWDEWLRAVEANATRNPHPESAQLTIGTAYRSMLSFIEQYWERLDRSDDVSNLLSATASAEDGDTADPAQWHDWEDAVAAVRAR